MKPMPLKVKIRLVLAMPFLIFCSFMLFACLDRGNWIGVLGFGAGCYVSFDYLWEFFATPYWQEPK